MPPLAFFGAMFLVCMVNFALSATKGFAFGLPIMSHIDAYRDVMGGTLFFDRLLRTLSYVDLLTIYSYVLLGCVYAFWSRELAAASIKYLFVPTVAGVVVFYITLMGTYMLSRMQ